MSNWQCPDCDSFNPETVDHCLTCGSHRTGDAQKVDGTPAAYQVTCPKCEGNNPPTRPLCQWCGEKLPAEAFPEEAAPPPTSAGSTRANSLGKSGRPQGPAQGSASVGPAGNAVNARPPSPAARDNAFMPVSTAETELAASKRREHSKAARPCFACGTMMEPDEWTLVAGPRLLCPYCFHEEFGTKAQSDPEKAASNQVDNTGNAADSAGGRAGQLEPSSENANKGPAYEWRAGAGFLVTGLLCLIGGGVVTYLWTFTWGFTPLAAGIVLTGAGIMKAKPDPKQP